ncbi:MULTISPECIES: putative entry exclusion protein TrbK-alt [unclassified Novosphingobium]|uniref:putative entry exclusion protein TrbK-alt n=1 Tax=unclassified Novosphingobium TaxID=2644732 RepID=UPI0025F07CA5|nr:MULTISPECIES: putative entry exclusion protein TrbK-alt [unclassified Novosphingobium]HQV03503.1 putative entry exclusion protein TrbK-alt [Novosphingobium sp.]
MDTKHFARIGAGAFVAIALTMSVLQLREERPDPLPEVITVFEPDGDPLPAQLRACAAMGERALSAPDCQAVWAEKRRRFLGQGGEASAPASDPAFDAGEAPAPAPELQPAKGL